ncbi:MAG TPA: PEP-CTERM sorting domain-containing protein [Phycisphaerales bacterium]|nr:PEP-CTERM sorting domain-containing protein [Phycisphaerales bacterium]
MRVTTTSSIVAALCAAGPASAGTLLVTASVGSRAASVEFVASGTNLVVTLTNTSAADALVPVDILTGVFFDIAGAPVLTRSSAVVAMGSTVHFGPTDPGGVVGGEWAFKGALVGAPWGADFGISSAGLGLFGPGDRFPGSDLQPPPSPDGLQYGITTAGDNPATGNAAVTGGGALIQNAVVFTVSGLPLGFDPMLAISGISFQYGTALSEPNIVPGPAGLALLAAAGLGWTRRRRA